MLHSSYGRGIILTNAIPPFHLIDLLQALHQAITTFYSPE